ncbi:uncharacterized protein LOC121307097 [Polyodon spathula]|uniref:uncharacterized protein LOC121307097 n=1 Tax=Polyodon spathula TaxID=7913 RepID=UPI001B7EADA3|nr:uncharacterized protein LOC121307097 [Polyodon spathula]XP_041095152.1 uncharacterized protein LOC121307097 [Polyodon spathula]XP_041095153.1 uncharacterized protein LOC121307097 [Polyodon spathula]
MTASITTQRVLDTRMGQFWENPEENKWIQDFCDLKMSKDYPYKLARMVEKHMHEEMPLAFPEGYSLRISTLNNTVLRGRKDMMEAWQELYLPRSETMVVIGAIDNFPCLAQGLQLIVMVDSKGNVYTYENEVLHYVEPSVKDFFTRRRLQSSVSYEKGGYCDQLTKEEYMELRKAEDIQKIERSMQKFVQSKQNELGEMLNLFR